MLYIVARSLQNWLFLFFSRIEKVSVFVRFCFVRVFFLCLKLCKGKICLPLRGSNVEGWKKYKSDTTFISKCGCVKRSEMGNEEATFYFMCSIHTSTSQLVPSLCETWSEFNFSFLLPVSTPLRFQEILYSFSPLPAFFFS